MARAAARRQRRARGGAGRSGHAPDRRDGTAAKIGASGRLWVKDEGRLPTGSFKARGLALAVSMAKSYGVQTMAMPTNGNAGAACPPMARAPG
jgi:threonine synthase